MVAHLKAQGEPEYNEAVTDEDEAAEGEMSCSAVSAARAAATIFTIGRWRLSPARARRRPVLFSAIRKTATNAPRRLSSRWKKMVWWALPIMSASARSWWAIIALTVRAALARHLRVAPLALLALLSAVSPAAALSAEERALVGRVERYLGDLQALAAPFIQVSSAGKMARGRLYLWRPGRLRFDYDPPTPIVINYDGRWVS